MALWKHVLAICFVEAYVSFVEAYVGFVEAYFRDLQCESIR